MPATPLQLCAGGPVQLAESRNRLLANPCYAPFTRAVDGHEAIYFHAGYWLSARVEVHGRNNKKVKLRRKRVLYVNPDHVLLVISAASETQNVRDSPADGHTQKDARGAVETAELVEIAAVPPFEVAFSPFQQYMIMDVARNLKVHRSEFEFLNWFNHEYVLPSLREHPPIFDIFPFETADDLKNFISYVKKTYPAKWSSFI